MPVWNTDINKRAVCKHADKNLVVPKLFSLTNIVKFQTSSGCLMSCHTFRTETQTLRFEV
ncbi:hypothetical protein X975_16837, partial [Stegodyphus mimosarum]